MRRLVPCIAFVACFGAVAGAMASGASDLAEVGGTWEGESICQVANSPCHDERVIYEIAEEKEGKAKIEGYKIVNGEKQWMGTLLCEARSTYSPAYQTRASPVTGLSDQGRNDERDAGASRKQDTLSENESENEFARAHKRGLNVTWYQPGNYDWSIKR